MSVFSGQHTGKPQDGDQGGPRRVRERKIPKEAEPFWKPWRTGYLRQQGYSLSKGKAKGN